MSVQQLAIERAVNMLKGAGAQFKIITADGQHYGELEAVVPAPRKRKVYTRPRGEMRDHFIKYIMGMVPGGYAEVPAGDYSLEDVRGPLTSWACAKWGNGSVMTSINRDKNVVEVIRTI